MILFTLRRFTGFAATLLVAALVIFYLLDLLPGDPAQFILGINATPESVARLRAQLGLDAPAHERFIDWVWGMLQGDFGMSHTQRAPVAQLIWDRLGAHIGEPVAAWLMRNRHRVRAHLLPPYAPELNPVELIWGHTKSNPLANFAPSQLDELLDQTQLATLAIGDDEPMLRSFLKHCPLSLRLK